MRVERFALFFPLPGPLRVAQKADGQEVPRRKMLYLFRRTRGETEYAVGPLPLGGFVKISGMNPDETLPDEVRTRAYYSQPVWKRIVVIGAGPLVNFVLAFILLFVVFAIIGAESVTDRVGTVEKGYPAAGSIQPGDRLVSVDGKRGDTEALSKAISAHRCPGEAAAKGLPGRRTGPARGRARRQAARARAEPDLRPGRRAHATRFRLCARTARGPAHRSRDRAHRRPLRAHHLGDDQGPRAPLRRREAQGDHRHRRDLRDHPADDPRRRRRRGRDPRRDLARARGHQHVPLPAARRRPHLLGHRGEGAPRPFPSA